MSDVTERMYYDGPIVFQASDDLDGWWTIVKAEHGGRREFVPREYGSALWLEERLSDACIEGPTEEMELLAQAILDGEFIHFKRCSADPEGDHWLLCSPRNSRKDAMIPKHHAEAAAKAFLERDQ